MVKDRSYTGGIKALGEARVGLIKRQMKTQSILGGLDFIGDIAGAVSSVTGFIGSQKKRADTAWGEYEKGYEALGGKDTITRPKFGDEGWLKSTFKGPGEGEVRIGERMYDKANIKKAGKFLDTDAATALFAGDKGKEMRASYLERTAPGRKAPGSIEGFDYNSLIDPETGKMVMSPEQYDRKVSIANLPSMKDPTIADFRSPPTSLQQWSVGGIESQSYLQPESVTSGPQIPESQLSENLPTYGMSAEQRSSRKAQEQQWRLNKMPEANPFEVQQEQFYKEDPYKKRNIWDSLQLNNKNRGGNIY